MNFTPNFVVKLTSSLGEKFAPFGEIVSECPLDVAVTSIRNY